MLQIEEFSLTSIHRAPRRIPFFPLRSYSARRRLFLDCRIYRIKFAARFFFADDDATSIVPSQEIS